MGRARLGSALKPPWSLDLSLSQRGKPQIKSRGGSRNPRAGAEGEGCPQLGTSQSCTPIPRSGGFGQNHSPEVERGGGAPHSEPKPTEPSGTSTRRFLALLLFLHFAPPPVTPLPRGLRFLAPLFAPRLPLPACGSTWRAPATGAGYKRLAAAADCGLRMRPKESGRACAGTPPGPGHPAAVTPTPPPAADPAPKPSAEPEPAPAQPPATGQGAGSGSSSVSRPPARARRASEPGSEAGVQRASAFWGRTAQSVHRNSDAPWTRFIFQGPFGPRATGLGIGKAAGIWKTPAAYIGRRPGESGPERAAFIRELGEALCPDRLLPAKKVTQEDVKVMLNLLEERERDLSTAARIGQSLVKQNSVLMEENSELEAMLGSAGEEILQLRHQVSLRDDLLQLYSDSDEEEEEEEEAEEEEEEEEEEHQYGRPYEPPEPSPLTEVKSGHHCPQLGALQEQLRLLKEENHQLREEASHLDALEEEEQMLILDCVEQFSEASQQMAELSEVLALRMENHDRQQREVTQLRTQVLKLQQRCQLYGAETKKLQQQLASEKEIQMQLQDELQDLRAKYTECGGMLIEAQEEVKTLRQQAPVSSGSVTHCAYTVPLEALPGFQETLAEELRMSIRRIISDPVFFMERNCERTTEEVSGLGCELHHSEEQEQEQGIEAEKGLMPAEDFVVEDFMPEEELWATEEVVLAEEGVTEEAELVSEEAEAWEEVEPEVDEATRTHVVASALEAGGLGSSHLDMKYVLQQLANWQDTHYRQQLRQKTLQKGASRSLGGNCSPSAYSCGICTGFQISTLPSPGAWAEVRAWDCSPPLRLSPLSLPASSPSPPPFPPSPRLPNHAAMAAAGQNKHGGQGRGAAALGANPGLSEAGGGQGQGGRGAFWGHPGLWDKGLHQQGPQLDQSPGLRESCLQGAHGDLMTV